MSNSGAKRLIEKKKNEILFVNKVVCCKPVMFKKLTVCHYFAFLHKVTVLCAYIIVCNVPWPRQMVNLACECAEVFR
jgi:hypothetical protein